MKIRPGLRSGRVVPPPSKSHAHRLLIANFLAGGGGGDLDDNQDDAADIAATKRSLRALLAESSDVVLDCGESGSTLRFLSPIAAALGKRAVFKTAGRLSERPFVEYPSIESGVHELRGDVSSQFVTGLLFALPLIKGDSEIRFTSPLESVGYVNMTLDVIRRAGIEIEEIKNGFKIRGSQSYRRQITAVEADWSGAAFWYAMNALGCRIAVDGLCESSAQPDRAISKMLPELARRVDVSQCPDIFPVLSVVAAARPGRTVFSGIRRLRLKECDRVAAMEDVLSRFGAKVEASEGEFKVDGTGGVFSGGKFPTYDDHRIAMSVAVGAVVAEGDVEIDNPHCVSKSYPGFFGQFESLDLILV